ncbi:M48 family metallopeptidase [Desnuesiella massiliensis]|uniref:M48 family metallopeptidase n=1 Tax=Desnuesiella massiliensis TaxID=1650662 RepID=UPI0006E3B541|nr:SprT family zinc-dependent metalloprotease [Desnuesiella massiliensis]
MTLNISGIPIEVCKKNIKNMHLYVKPPNGNVMVSAPLSMSDEAIERFVRTKVSWIKRQVEKFDNQPRQSQREYISGETLYVWGKQYYLRTEYGNRNSLVLSGDKAILTVRKESTALQREKFIREWYRDLLKAEINVLLPKCEKITGLKATSWQTKYMTSRWGTCNTQSGKIWLNLQLAKKTPECLEYVIIHELAHLIEKNHNERFVSLMDKFMPMWREIKMTLNGQTLDYME